MLGSMDSPPYNDRRRGSQGFAASGGYFEIWAGTFK